MKARQEERTCQVKVLPNNIVMGYSEGKILYVTPTMARTLSDQKAVKILGNGGVGPTENKNIEDVSKKFSDARRSIPSTDSASSNPSGGEQQSSASGEAQALPGGSATQSSRSESSEQGEETTNQYAALRSTTRSSSHRGSISSTSRTSAGGRGTTRGRSSRTSKD